MPPAAMTDPADLFGWQGYNRGAMALAALGVGGLLRAFLHLDEEGVGLGLGDQADHGLGGLGGELGGQRGRGHGSGEGVEELVDVLEKHLEITPEAGETWSIEDLDRAGSAAAVSAPASKGACGSGQSLGDQRWRR